MICLRFLEVPLLSLCCSLRLFFFLFFFADLIAGIRKEKEAGTLPPNVASGMEELYWNYKTAVYLFSPLLP